MNISNYTFDYLTSFGIFFIRLIVFSNLTKEYEYFAKAQIRSHRNMLCHFIL